MYISRDRHAVLTNAERLLNAIVDGNAEPAGLASYTARREAERTAKEARRAARQTARQASILRDRQRRGASSAAHAPGTTVALNNVKLQGRHYVVSGFAIVEGAPVYDLIKTKGETGSATKTGVKHADIVVISLPTATSLSVLS